MAFGGEGIGVEGNEWIFRARLLKGVVECKETWEVGRVCYESCPNCLGLLGLDDGKGWWDIPFLESAIVDEPAMMMVVTVTSKILWSNSLK
jgi:hypothetical protein